MARPAEGPVSIGLGTVADADALGELWRDTGLGRALMQRLETAFIAKGRPKVNLLVRQGNEQVVTVHESLEFRADPMGFVDKWLDGS